MKTDPSKSIHQFLAEHKGVSLEEAKSMNQYVTDMAASVGLKYDFDKTVPANSFNAHRFLHFTKQYGKQNEAEELLFKAYFTEGKNIDDAETLIALAQELGLDVAKLTQAMGSEAYVNEVVADIEEAQHIGVRGVPFFVFDRKYAVSGAQTPEVFLQTLEKSFEEWQVANPKLTIIEGDSCSVDGECN